MTKGEWAQIRQRTHTAGALPNKVTKPDRHFLFGAIGGKHHSGQALGKWGAGETVLLYPEC